MAQKMLVYCIKMERNMPGKCGGLMTRSVDSSQKFALKKKHMKKTTFHMPGWIVSEEKGL